ncbi:MAG: Enhancer of polycomb-like protein 1 [Bogoriella megaspora]|nr:MAG: Enhancer of polycomb-like protein 1 [Bogoriella megaspora]
MTQRQTGARFRQRKLSTKQNLAVLRENEVEKSTAEDEAQRHIPRVETGVEKGEEIEHHLQAVISASAAAAVGGKVAQIFIPTPEAKASSEVKYSDLYPRQFSQPATYIRFSSTVEDCIGTPYCMTGDDEVWLKTFNAKRGGQRGRNASDPCSEDTFEEVVSFFEATAQNKQPFAAVDSPPVISFEEIETAFDDTLNTSARAFARDIYMHWKSERSKRNNYPLQSNLKFETGQETDDSDPYVCFRRREVRQVRKTRGRDAQVTEKLKKLRRELEDARHLLHMVQDRETLRRDQLAIDKSIFEQRNQVKEVKRGLNIKDGDEDLINQPVYLTIFKCKSSEKEHLLTKLTQRPIKPKVKTDAGLAQRTPGAVIRPPQRLDGRPPDAELILLEDQKAERQRYIDQSVQERINQHRTWNHGFRDDTWRPITPPLEPEVTGFQRVFVTHGDALPSPPPSDEGMDLDKANLLDSDAEAMDVARSTTEADEPRIIRHATASSLPLISPTPSPRPQFEQALSFRTRVGRSGRLWLDRRKNDRIGPEVLAEMDRNLVDRMKYDSDNDEDDGEGGFSKDILYPVDHYDDQSMRFRAAFAVGPPRRESIGADGRRISVAGIPPAAVVAQPQPARMVS